MVPADFGVGTKVLTFDYRDSTMTKVDKMIQSEVGGAIMIEVDAGYALALGEARHDMAGPRPRRIASASQPRSLIPQSGRCRESSAAVLVVGIRRKHNRCTPISGRFQHRSVRINTSRRSTQFAKEALRVGYASTAA